MPILIVNPTTDAEFGECAESLAESCPTPADLQAALRAYYPRTVVRPRELSGEREAWYVYRDGQWIPSRLGGAEEIDHDRGSSR